jgi:3-oxoacyl-[acyl-carrier protein] reductase
MAGGNDRSRIVAHGYLRCRPRRYQRPTAPARRHPGEWAAALGINLTAAATLTFALLPTMLERKWGRVVNVSSGVAARSGFMVGGNAYTTAKAALEAHTLNLAAPHDYFAQTHARGALLTPEVSARPMAARLAGDPTGQLWDVADPV